jgi:predicted transcriptional regulator
MNALKEATIETIKKLPDNCSVEDIMYEINFISQVYDGLKDADEGRLISTDELLKKVTEWGK